MALSSLAAKARETLKTLDLTEEQQSTVQNVYLWMTAGLGLSGVVAGYIHGREAWSQALGGNVFVLAGLIVAELVFVLFLSARIQRMAPSEALLAHAVYALLTGITFAAIFSVHTSADIGKAFLLTAAMFGAASFYAMTTRRNLSGWRHYLLMALGGVTIALIVNLSLESAAVDWIVSLVAIAIFVILTAYDTRRVVERDGETKPPELGVLGALRIYLDLVNIFFFLLRLIGGRE